MFFLLVNLIGTQPYCTLDRITQEIQCNYTTMEDCESYRQENEICVDNPNLK